MYPHAEITDRIIGCAIEVHQHLGPAFHESVYQLALAHEMTLNQIQYQKEMPVTLAYKGQTVGQYRLDFLVENEVVVELKALEALADVHLSQMLSYLAATEKKVGLLINFGQTRLVDGIKRVIH